MDLPVMPPVAPMLSRAADGLPEGHFGYEPKWDGFRCITFRDGAEVELASRSTKPLTRYFPDIVATVRAGLPPRCVVDGEIVVAGAGGLDFDLLSQRIHPAASRVGALAAAAPADLVVWDVLALGGRDLRGEPFADRRAAVAEIVDGARPDRVEEPSRVVLTPLTTDVGVARGWWERFEGAGLDGVVAKDLALPYREGQRVMVKVKHARTGDFVVGGFRWYKDHDDAVGSLMLGLYDGGELHHVGVIGAFPLARRHQLVAELAPARRGVGDHPWASWAEALSAERPPPGTTSRWNAGKDLRFELLAPELVVEAAFEHLQGRRLRHTARFARWRPDRDPRSCTYDQLDVAAPSLLADVFAAGRPT